MYLSALYLYIQTGDIQVAEFITQDIVFFCCGTLLDCLLGIYIQIFSLLLAYWMYNE